MLIPENDTPESDLIIGSDSNDSVGGGADRDFLYGMSGDDYVLGGGGDDFLSGGSGNDTLIGGEGIDELDGGEGSDTLYAETASVTDPDFDTANFAPNYFIDESVAVGNVFALVRRKAWGDLIDAGSGVDVLVSDAYIGGWLDATATPNADEIRKYDLSFSLEDWGQYLAHWATTHDMALGGSLFLGGAGQDQYFVGFGDHLYDSDGDGEIYLNGVDVSHMKLGCPPTVLVGLGGGNQAIPQNCYLDTNNEYLLATNFDSTKRALVGIDGVVRSEASFVGDEYFWDGLSGRLLPQAVFHEPTGTLYVFLGYPQIDNSEDATLSANLLDMIRNDNPDDDRFLTIHNFKNGDFGIEIYHDSDHEVRDYVAETVREELEGTEQDDQIDGDNSDEELVGRGGDDTLNANGGDDLIRGGSGADLIDGGSGLDLLRYTEGSGGVTVDLRSGTGSRGEAEGDIYRNVEGAVGTTASDVFYSGSGSTEFYGEFGNDLFYGGDGGDYFNGGWSGMLTYELSAVPIYVTTAAASSFVSARKPFGGSSAYVDVQGFGRDHFELLGKVVGSPFDDTIESGSGGSFGGGAGQDLLTGSSGSESFSGGDGDDTLLGNDGDDVLRGDDGNDRIEGGAGENRLEGGSGDDTLIGGSDGDIIFGGDGDDFVADGFGTGEMNGGAGRDTVDLTHSDDGFVFDVGAGTLDWGVGGDEIAIGFEVVLAGAGASSIIGGAEDNAFYSGAGNDTLVGGEGGDAYHYAAGDGVDLIDDNGSSGVDRISITGHAAANTTLSREGTSLVIDFGAPGDQIRVADAFAGEGIEEIAFADSTLWDSVFIANNAVVSSTVLSGTSGDETLTGGASAELIEGLGGNDLLRGGGGDDTYRFARGDGRDTIEDTGGTPGDALLLQGYARDEIVFRPASFRSADLRITFTNSSDEIIIRNTLHGGSNQVESILLDDGSSFGIRELYRIATLTEQASGAAVIGTEASETLTGGGGAERVEGLAGNDRLNGSGGDDLHLGGDGNDTLVGNSGTDHYFGGEGIDLLEFLYTWADVDINLAEGLIKFPVPQIAWEIENVIGTTGKNLITGTDGANYLDGADGHDTIIGGAGNDTIDGGQGDDQQFGGLGDDLIIAGGGVDDFYGGAGNDTLELTYSTYGVEIDLAAGVVRFPSPENAIEIENVIATRGGNRVIGSDVANMLDGHEGNDTVTGGLGDDTLIGGLGNDSLNGESGADSVQGGDGADTVLGGAGADTLSGGTGNDSLDGGSGSDELEGGTGNDTLLGNSGSDSLFGGSGADDLDGGDGDDTLDGGDGGDLYRFVPNSGDDVIDETGTGGSNRLVLPGVLESDVALAPDTSVGARAGDLALGFLSGPGTLRILGGVQSIQEIAFDSGTVWSSTELITRAGLDPDDPANGLPVAADDAFATTENASIAGNLFVDNGFGADSPDAVVQTLAGNAFIDGATLTNPNGSTFTLFADGSFVFDPTNAYDYLSLGETVTTTLPYTIAGPAGQTASADISITLTGENDAPVMVGRDLLINEGTTTYFHILSNTGEADANALITHEILNQPRKGEAYLSGPFFYFDADGAAFNGLAAGETENYTIQVRATDEHGAQSNTVDINVSVRGRNDGPIAVDDLVSVTANAPQAFDVFADNGSGADADPDITDVLTVASVDGVAASVGQTVTLSSGALLTINADGTANYDPNGVFDALVTGEYGTDTATYTVQDSLGVASSAVSITFDIAGTGPGSAPNLDPITQRDDFYAQKGTTITGNVFADNGSGPDTDPNRSDILTVTNIDDWHPSAPQMLPVGVDVHLRHNSTLRVEANGDFTFTPAPSFDNLGPNSYSGEAFYYDISDGQSGTGRGLVSIEIGGGPQSSDPPPLVVDDAFSVAADRTLTANVLADNGMGADQADFGGLTVSEIQGQPALVSIPTPLSSGATVVMLSNGDMFYDPGSAFLNLVEGQSASDSFSYTARDQFDRETTGTVTITIEGTQPNNNQAPTVADFGFVANAAVTTTIADLSIPGDDPDPDDDGSTLTYELVTGPSFGAAAIVGTELRFSPGDVFIPLADGELQTVTAEVQARDSFGIYSNVATASIVVEGVNDTPSAFNDSFTMLSNEVLVANVLQDNGSGADSDPDSDALVVDTVFGLTSGPGTIFPSSTGLTTSIDPDGTLTLTPNGAFDDLAPGETDTWSLRYSVADPSGASSDEAFVYITIIGKPSNTAPIAADDQIGAAADVPTVGNLLIDNGSGPDSDPEDDPLAVLSAGGIALSPSATVSFQSGATITVAADGTFTFTPNGAYSDLAPFATATESFVYTVGDPGGLTSTATATVTVTAGNTAPILSAGTLTDDLGGTDPTLTLSSLGDDQDTDDDGTTLIYEVVTQPSKGTVSVTGTGASQTLSFDDAGAFLSLADGDSEAVSATLRAIDKHGAASDPADVTITVNGVNDAPIAVNETFVLDFDEIFVGNVLIDNGDGADLDPDTGDTISVVRAGLGLQPIGSQRPDEAQLAADGTITYDPTVDFTDLGSGSTGYSSIDYEIEDASGAVSLGRVNFQVRGVDPIPPKPTLQASDLAIELDPANTQTGLSDNAEINLGNYLSKTHAIAFETGGDVDTTQVIYEQGGSSRGLNVFIQQGMLHAAVWNFAEENWGYREVTTAIAADTRYTTTAIMDGALPAAGNLSLALNGQVVGTTDGVGQLYAHSDDIGIGQVRGSTVIDGSTVSSSMSFLGSVETLVQYNALLAPSAAADLEAYTAHDWLAGADLPANLAPEAADDAFTVLASGILSMDLFADNGEGKDTDRDIGDVISVSAVNGATDDVGQPVTLASGALLTVTADGTASYDPGSAFNTLITGETATDSFSYSLEDPEGGTDTATVTITVSGTAPPAPGSAVGEVGTVTASQTDGSQWHTVSFGTLLSNPSVVLGPLGPGDSEPATLRVRNVTDSGFEFQIDEWEYQDGVRGPETLSWMAVNAGRHTLANGLQIEAGSSSATHSVATSSFTEAFADTPIVLAQVTTTNEAEAVIERLSGVTANGFQFRLDEEEAADRTRAGEALDWIAVSQINAPGVFAATTGDSVTQNAGAVSFGTAFSGPPTPAIFADLQSRDGGDTSTARIAAADHLGTSVFVEEEQSRDSELGHTTETVGILALEDGLLFV
ncbi:MAG: Ig-like domain-containing protein [Pseudomonadota bacterium]